jgi:transcriptional regulator with XRE-family HTH domain
MALDEALLYRLVGEKVRAARLRAAPSLSQEKLARRLGVSRASVVNIEAGRQRPPLHVLWQIAEALNTELTFLIPRQSEYQVGAEPVRLDAQVVSQIEKAASGDAATRRKLTDFISAAQNQLSGDR